VDDIGEALARIEQKIDENGRRSEERHRELSARVDRMQAEIESLQKHVAALNADDKSIRHELEKAKIRIESLETRFSDMREEQNRAKRMSTEGDEAQQAALQSAMIIQERALAALRDEVAKAEAKRAEAEAKRQDAEASRVEQSKLQTEALNKLVEIKDWKTVRRAMVAGAFVGAAVIAAVLKLIEGGVAGKIAKLLAGG
jgi:colicin import membrane protein